MSQMTNEEMLEIIKQRLIEDQLGPIACWEGGKALLGVESALMYLKARNKCCVIRKVDSSGF